MNISSKGRALALGAFVFGFITQAADASADVLCRAAWPATFTQCKSNVTFFGEAATGSGRTTSTTIRVTATLVNGLTSASAVALGAQGNIVCQADDRPPIDSVPATKDCLGIPTVFFLTAH